MTAKLLRLALWCAAVLVVILGLASPVSAANTGDVAASAGDPAAAVPGVQQALADPGGFSEYEPPERRLFSRLLIAPCAKCDSCACDNNCNCKDKCALCNVPLDAGGCKCDSSCGCIAATYSKCDKCNYCGCNDACECKNKCDLCNVPLNAGGCQCDSNCNCKLGPIPPPGGGGTTTTTVKGYYHQTWLAGRTAPSGSNMGVAFSGWNDVSNALSESAAVIGKLPSPKYLDIGGGDATGRFTAALITKLNNNLAAIKSAGYQGICYDIEEGDSGLASAFTDSFKKAKAAGLTVLVTVSHSEPYGISDAGAVMNAIFASADVDYISPQLYTTGTETANDYTATGTPWSAYKTAKGKVIVSIAKGSMYADAESKFAGFGITTYGYVAWA